MRISRLAGIGLVLSLTLSAAAAAGGVSFRSGEDALKQGIAAFNGGY